jgi:cytochrome c peroxidase
MGRIGTPLCHAVAILESDDGICYIPYQLPIPSRTIGLVWRKTSGRSDLPTDSAADELGKHKVMSLRNIALTAPYGHNGAMATLEQIVHFYI